jgi:hypothetical protein
LDGLVKGKGAVFTNLYALLPNLARDAKDPHSSSNNRLPRLTI